MSIDPLSEALRTVRLSGAVFFVWEIVPPVAMSVPDGSAIAPVIVPGAEQVVSYHIVTRGSCWGGLVGEAPLRLERGDVLLVPRGAAYAIASSEAACRGARVDAQAACAFFGQMAAGALPFVVRDGGAGEVATELVCGFLGCDLRPFNPVLAALPPLLRVRLPGPAQARRLQALIALAVEEARTPLAGSECVLLRLGELLFVEVLRRCLSEGDGDGAGWMAGLRDPVTGHALRLLHAEPAAPWTLQALASRIGVSRTRLVETFTRQLGQPPMQYLTSWRLQLAAARLADGQAKVASVAREVGYASEAAFSRAFKRRTGVPPVRWAHAHRRPALPAQPASRLLPGNM